MQPESSSNKTPKIITAVIVGAIVVGAAVGVAAMNNKKSNDNATSQPTTSQTTSSTTSESQPADAQATAPSSTATSSDYKDGTYTATGSYTSPGGQEDITITVTLKGDTVTDTSAKSGAHDPEGQEYQAEFIQSYKSQVVGKKITAIKLSKVSGSSLTSQGFNDALAKIQSQAKV